jgi:hydroxymethylpyrimidine pyrophosphatase-like HAD family hydrolase
MELVVFDLDGTLLNRRSVISAYTGETLQLLAERDIAYTVATGRTLHGARAILDGHRFCRANGLTPFLFTLDEDNGTTVYHPPGLSELERDLVRSIGLDEPVTVRALDELSPAARITHVNAIGEGGAIEAVLRSVNDEPHLVAYSGVALEGQQWRWLDIHHSDSSKGGAIEDMKRLLGLERVICFGDSDNDLSMFETADESYAPANANERIKSAATAVIGHHDDEGIARFLRERFALDSSR